MAAMTDRGLGTGETAVSFIGGDPLSPTEFRAEGTVGPRGKSWEVIAEALHLLEVVEGDPPHLVEYKEEAYHRLNSRTKFYQPTAPCQEHRRGLWVFPRLTESQRTLHALCSLRHPLWLFLFCCLVPPAVVGLIYGGIPLGQFGGGKDFDDKLVYLMVLLPVTFCTYATVLTSEFLGFLELKLSFRHTWRKFLLVNSVVFVAAPASLFLIYPFTDSFPAMGFIPYGATLLAFLVVMLSARRVFMPNCVKNECTFYWQKVRTSLKIMALTAFMFALFVGYTLVYRQIPGEFQKMMTGLWVFILLFLKKGCLTITEMIPYELSMLFAGFGVNNMSDTFFVAVYPNIQDPQSTYTIIFFIISGTDYLYLLFITRTWFRFRIWIKGRLKSCFCCRKYRPERFLPIEEDIDLDDRGQTNSRPGYLRRQVQFFYYRVMSAFTAQFFYLIVAPILRYWNNAQFFPFSSNPPQGSDPLTEKAFRNSVIYAAARLGTLTLLVPISFWVVRKLAPVALKQCMVLYRRLFTSPRFIFRFAAILLANQLLCAWMALAPNEIWYLDLR